MDNAIGLGIILSLQDKASSGLQAVRNQMTALRDVSQDMVKRFDEGAKQLVAGIALMATGVKVLGLLNSTFGASITTAADFEQAMARVGAVSGATGEDFERLTQQAKDLGRETQFSATQAAASQENLARAGFQTNEIINAMPGLLNMAAAEGMDLANAADIASSAIRGFGLNASEANRVADVLAKTSSASNTSIALLGESLKYAAGPAKALGFTIEQTNAMLGIMANSGIKGTQAGNALKSAFLRLSKEPKQVAKALNEMGVKAKDSEGNLRTLPELLKDLSVRMAGMGKADKLGMLGKIFGDVASTGMLALMDAVANGSLPDLETALYSCSGAAQAMAERMNATAQGAMLRLESASEGLRIVIGNHLLPVYTKIIDAIAQFKSWLTQLIEAHPVITKAVIGFTAALIGLSGATLLVVGGLTSISGFMKMWPLLKIMAVSALSNIRMQARMALASFTKLSVPIVGLVALAGVLFYAWRKNLWGIRDMVTAVTEGFKMALSASTDGIAEVDEELANKLKDAGIWDFAVTMGKVFFRVRQFWNGLVEGFKEGLDFLQKGFEWFKNIFAPVVESGQELLKFLGILKPVTKTQANTWKAWGQLLGRLVPIIGGVILAFKGFNIITGIIGTIGQAILGMFSLIMAHPVIAVIVALVTAGIYLYNYWEEITEDLAKLWDKIKGYGQAAADWIKKKWQQAAEWIKQKWQALENWWNSWTIDDVFAVVKGYASRAWTYVKGKWQEFENWWNSWTLADVWQSVKDSLNNAVEDMKQVWQNFKDWIKEKFSNLNPFNWEIPSWLGGGKAGDNQVRNSETAGVYLPPEIPPAKIQPEMFKAPLFEINSESINNAKNIAELNDSLSRMARMGIEPSTGFKLAALSANVPTDIDGLLSNVVGRDIEVMPSITLNPAPSSPLLIQHTQNQSALGYQTKTDASVINPEQKVDVHTDVKVDVKPVPVEISLGIERIASEVIKWTSRQSIRSGEGNEY